MAFLVFSQAVLGFLLLSFNYAYVVLGLGSTKSKIQMPFVFGLFVEGCNYRKIVKKSWSITPQKTQKQISDKLA